MRLVNNQCVIGLQVRVALGFGQQNTVGHELDRCVFGQSVLKANFVAHHIAQRRFKLLGNPFCYRRCSNPPRLGVSNQLSFTRRVVALAAPQGQCNFGQLGGFARARFTADDDHLVGGNGGGDFVASRRNGQRFREGNIKHQVGKLGKSTQNRQGTGTDFAMPRNVPHSMGAKRWC